MEPLIESSVPWYSLHWFYPSTLETFDWENGYALYFLYLIPVVVLIRLLFAHILAQKLTVALMKKSIKPNLWTFVRFFPDLLAALFLATLILAFARPQTTNEKVEQWTEGIDIMLVIDISQSMQIEDFKPNRLEAAKDVARKFINGRFQDRIGLVIFSGDAYSLSPLTTDYDLLTSYIEDIRFDMIENRGTAIGSALAVATNRMAENSTESKVCILLSDGDNTAGNIDPIMAAKLAYSSDIKIYTIAVGKEGKVPFGKDFFGRPRMVENTLDESTLREIAKIGEGKFYRVSNNQALEEVFAEIDQFEKAEIKESRYRDTTDYYHNYLYWALCVILAWMLLKSTFLTNVLQD